MKKILIILTAILLFSCEDLLVEKPKSISVETFYTNSAEIETALAAIYTPLRNGYGFGALYISMHEISSDWFIGRASYAPQNEYQGLNSGKSLGVGSIWQQFYLSIRNANLVIKNIPEKAIVSDELKNKYIAEAKFLRALTYFHLVRSWGGVPLKTEENIDVVEVPKSTKEEVYQLITNDLLFAQDNLPDNAPVAGRPTKWAAKTVLADVYFFQGLNDEASIKASEVIQSGKYSLVSVTTPNDFDNIFGPTVVTSPEEIFYLKWSSLDGWGYPLYTGGIKTPYLGDAGYMALYSYTDNPLYASWDNNDLRKTYGWFLWDFALGSNTILNKKFCDLNRPPRNDYPMYRYADILLLYAESSCRAADSPTADGMEKLNMVHRRAYGYDPLQPSIVDFSLSDYDKESFIKLVIKEKGYEFQAEGKRWFDLVRAGVAKEYIKATLGKDVVDKHFLWPIPDAEINYNKAINPGTDQNPGY